MEKRLTASQGNSGGSERSQLIDALQHLTDWDRLGEVIEFAAIRAGQIAPARHNNVRKDRMPRRLQRQATIRTSRYKRFHRLAARRTAIVTIGIVLGCKVRIHPGKADGDLWDAAYRAVSICRRY